MITVLREAWTLRQVFCRLHFSRCGEEGVSPTDEVAGLPGGRRS